MIIDLAGKSAAVTGSAEGIGVDAMRVDGAWDFTV